MHTDATTSALAGKLVLRGQCHEGALKVITNTPSGRRDANVDCDGKPHETPLGTVKVYVLVEQIEACFQLMEIRAALGRHFVGFNTGRWDYINSVADALAWDERFVNPNIDAIVMSYGYMRSYEDRVRRAVNTPDADGRFALWQGGMEPNIPVGSEKGVQDGMARAVAGGLTASTLIPLVLIPAVYSLFHPEPQDVLLTTDAPTSESADILTC